MKTLLEEKNVVVKLGESQPCHTTKCSISADSQAVPKRQVTKLLQNSTKDAQFGNIYQEC